MSESIKDTLASHSLFSLLPDNARQLLLECSKTRMFKPDEKLITEGEFNEHLYLIIAGKIKIVSMENTIATVSEGEIVGEISSSGMSSPVADAVAESDVVVIAFPLEAITDTTLEYPDFAEELRRIGMGRFD